MIRQKWRYVISFAIMVIAAVIPIGISAEQPYPYEEYEQIVYDFEVDGLYFKLEYSTANTVGVSSVKYIPIPSKKLFESPEYPCPEFMEQGRLNPRWLDEEGTLTIPETVEYNGKKYRIRRILDYGFAGNKDIRKLKLPQDIHAIEKCAFLGCSDLKEAKLPEKLEYIDDRAFSYTGLEEFKMPEYLWQIGSFAFSNCQDLKKFITNDYHLIFNNPGVLAGCPQLKEINIPEDTWFVNSYSFYGMSDLPVDFSAGITEIGGYCFKGNRTFRQVAFPTDMRWLGKCAFMNCENLWHLTFQSCPEMDGEVCPGSPLKLITAMGPELYYISKRFPHVSEYLYDSNDLYGELNDYILNPFFELWDIKISDYLTYNEGYFDNYSRLDFGSNAEDVELYLNPGADEYDDNPYAQLHEKATLLVPRNAPFKLAWKAAGEYICELPYLNGVEIKDVERVGDMNVVTLSGIKEDSKFFVKAINSKVETLTEESALYDIYSVDGMLLKSNVSDRELDTLPSGIYLLRNGDRTVKIIR